MGTLRIIVALGLACIAISTQVARGEEPRVVDQLLDILRQNKQITERQYLELKRRAEEERQEDLRKAGAPPPTPSLEAVVAAIPTPTALPGETMRAYFKNGWNLETADGKYKLNIGGRAQIDWNMSDPGGGVKRKFSLSGTDSGVEFRRARLSIAGVVYTNIDFKFEYDFATGSPAFKDVFIGMTQVPIVQYIRVGHFKEPFSLEEITSDDFTTFQERATLNAFAPSRNTGIAVYTAFLDQHLTYQLGGFHETNDVGFGFGSDQDYNLTTRLTGLPLYAAGQTLVHLGLGYTHKFRHKEDITFSQKPESHLFPVALANTGNINTDGVDLIDPEVAVSFGPASFQGEYAHAFVSQIDNKNLNFDSVYVEASYFLTGESRASFYNTRFASFDRVIPFNNFSIDGSHWGAWQLAARFSRLALDSKNINGGDLDDITAGINWYLNPNMKITTNYVWAHLESVGDSNIAEGRFQLTF